VAALEAICIEQRHEEPEVFFFAVVRRGGHEQEVAAAFGKLPAELIALGVGDVLAGHAGRHSVSFVAYHEIPFFGLLQLLLQIGAAAQHIQARNEQRRCGKGVARK